MYVLKVRNSHSLCGVSTIDIASANSDQDVHRIELMLQIGDWILWFITAVNGKAYKHMLLLNLGTL